MNPGSEKKRAQSTGQAGSSRPSPEGGRRGERVGEGGRGPDAFTARNRRGFSPFFLCPNTLKSVSRVKGAPGGGEWGLNMGAKLWGDIRKEMGSASYTVMAFLQRASTTSQGPTRGSPAMGPPIFLS